MIHTSSLLRIRQRGWGGLASPPLHFLNVNQIKCREGGGKLASPQLCEVMWLEEHKLMLIRVSWGGGGLGRGAEIHPHHQNPHTLKFHSSSSKELTRAVLQVNFTAAFSNSRTWLKARAFKYWSYLLEKIWGPWIEMLSLSVIMWRAIFGYRSPQALLFPEEAWEWYLLLLVMYAIV